MSRLNTSFRKSVATDVEPLIGLSRRTISRSYRSFLGDEAVDGFIESGSADQFVRDNIEHCWVLEQGGSIVGFSVIHENTIDLMMVDESRHRQGLGTELLAKVERLLRGNHDEIRLESFHDNEQANSFYRKNGWHELDRFQDKATGFNKITFQKEVPESF